MTLSHSPAEIPRNAHRYHVICYQTPSRLINIVYYLLLITPIKYWRMENFRIQKQDHTASWPFILSHGLMINQKIFIGPATLHNACIAESVAGRIKLPQQQVLFEPPY